MSKTLAALLVEIRRCTICAASLPLGPRPIVQLHEDAGILLVGPAPGRKTHLSGLPFADASGRRLRDWLGLGEDMFYDPRRLAIVPLGFCFPGTGAAGDLPPRPECAPAWRAEVLSYLPKIKLTLLVGGYAQQYQLPDKCRSVTDMVRSWAKYWPSVMPLPHPSPRNMAWFARNPWFAEELVPALRARVIAVMAGSPCPEIPPNSRSMPCNVKR